MKNGVFTRLIYEAQGAELVEPDRTALLIGLPLRVAKDQYLMSWDSDGSTGTIDATLANKLKTATNDKIYAGSDIKLYIRKANEEESNKLEMNTNKFVAAPIISKTNYNTAGATGPSAISIPPLCSLKPIADENYDCNLTVLGGGTGPYGEGPAGNYDDYISVTEEDMFYEDMRISGATASYTEVYALMSHGHKAKVGQRIKVIAPTGISSAIITSVSELHFCCDSYMGPTGTTFTEFEISDIYLISADEGDNSKLTVSGVTGIDEAVDNFFKLLKNGQKFSTKTDGTDEGIISAIDKTARTFITDYQGATGIIEKWYTWFGGCTIQVSGNKASDFMALLENGLTFYDSQNYSKIYDIDLTNKSFSTNFRYTEGAITPWDVYYDYEGWSLDNKAGSINRKPIISFDIIAQRTSVSGLKTIDEMDDLIQYFDESSLSEPESNLAFSSMLHLAANGSTNKFKIYAIPIDGTQSINSLLSNLTKWTNAFSKTKGVANIYFVVPLTNNETILDVAKTHVLAMSTTEMKRERIAFISEKILNRGDGYSEDDIEGENYIDTDYDADDDIETAVTVPSSYISERIVLIGPYYAKYGDTLLYGYHLAAIIAGYISRLELGHSTTGDSIPLIDALPALNYFSEDNLEDMKTAGWYLLNQEIYGGPIKCFHQKTTDQEILEKKELSLVIIIDALAKIIRATLKPYIARGITNRISIADPGSAVNKRYIKKLNNALSVIKSYLVDDIAALADFEVIGIAANEANRDQTDIKLKVTHYYPVNRINVIIYIV